MADDDKTIIVKKIKKSHGGHHGGSWKVAFADFATAMMAFFMLMWILAAATDPQKKSISAYFNNPRVFIGGGGPALNLIDEEVKMDKTSILEEQGIEMIDEAAILEAAEQMEQDRMEGLMENLEELIQSSQSLSAFSDQIILDITAEGLRIQIVDNESRPMFDIASAQLKEHTTLILGQLAGVIESVPNQVSLTGHTDGRPMKKDEFSNWELSTERANAARRALVYGGLKESKIAKVVGMAATALYTPDDKMNPVNRRINITVLKKTPEQIMEENQNLHSDSNTNIIKANKVTKALITENDDDEEQP